MRTRIAFAAFSAVAAAAASSWGHSGAPAAIKVAELVLSVLLWEMSMSLARGAGRRVLGRDAVWGSPAPLAGLVAAASLPATAGMLSVFALLGDRATSPLALYAQSLALGLLIAFARRGLRPARPQPSPAEAVARPSPFVAPRSRLDPTAAFLRRHAPKLAHRRILALEAEDHYLRIHTDGGTALVLMRLADAAAALGPEAGWRPHRSFWLAAGVPATAERSGQTWKLTLATGLAVPVSRANIGAMRAQGYGDRIGGRDGGRLRPGID